MHALDILIVALYFAAMLGVGWYFRQRQSSLDQYFVGGRRMGAGHVGFSVVATDVGGGFSIGLGGLGFAMGLSASWLLFSGLVGAWMAAVLVIPRVRTLGEAHGFRTFPDLLRHRFDRRTQLLAALVSAIGYAGFTGSQLLAGGKLTAAIFDISVPLAVLVMSLIIVVYTALGGLEAVVYTDSVQWVILLAGLLLFALPLGLGAAGGIEGLRAALPVTHFDLFSVGWGQFGAWMISIVPIWFVAMTLHQRIHACRNTRTARRAWLLAGLLEYPAMAFAGAALGMIARALYPTVDAEMGLPLLVREALPVGLAGLVIAAYLAAIMSTADSCLLASVGNIVGDVLGGRSGAGDERRALRLSRLLTLGIGFGSVGFALAVPRVIDSILLAYAFMVSGLLVPTLCALFWPRVGSSAAFWSMLVGGVSAVVLATGWVELGVDSTAVGLTLSAATLLLVITCRAIRRRISGPA